MNAINSRAQILNNEKQKRGTSCTQVIKWYMQDLCGTKFVSRTDNESLQRLLRQEQDGMV